MEHEMRARDTVSIGEDITPPLPPLACSLYDTSVPTHCSSCFRSLSTHPIDNATFVAYCSAQCAAADSPLHFSSAENSLFLLLNSPVPIWPHGDCADLRVSLRLLRRLELVSFFPHPPLAYRIAGFMTNRENLADAKDHLDCENFSRVRDGARLIAKARAMRDGREFSGDCEVEEAVLCLVLTNAVEVHVSGDDGVGLGIGVGVYDNRFSWMNHSCSPNSCYRFKMFSVDVAACENDMSRITPFCSGIQVEDDVPLQYWNKSEGCRNFGPRMVVRSIKMIKRGEEVTVTYIDLLQPMGDDTPGR